MGAFRNALIATALVLAVAPGCKRKKTPEPTEGEVEAALAEDGADTSDVEKDGENLVASLQPDPGSGAEFGEPAQRIYLPRACVTSVFDAPTRTATVTFDRCNGPRGLLGVSGEVKATVSGTPDNLTVDLVATDLTINGATVDWSAHANIVSTGLMRTMTWNAQLSGKTRRGREFSRTNEKTVSWTVGMPCIAFAGTSQGDVSGRNLRTEMTDLSICRGGCPDAGGRIVVTNLDTKTRIEVRFDGTAQGIFVGPNGRMSRFPLFCRA